MLLQKHGKMLGFGESFRSRTKEIIRRRRYAHKFLTDGTISFGALKKKTRWLSTYRDFLFKGAFKYCLCRRYLDLSLSWWSGQCDCWRVTALMMLKCRYYEWKKKCVPFPGQRGGGLRCPWEERCVCKHSCFLFHPRLRPAPHGGHLGQQHQSVWLPLRPVHWLVTSCRRAEAHHVHTFISLTLKPDTLKHPFYVIPFKVSLKGIRV